MVSAAVAVAFLALIAAGLLCFGKAAFEFRKTAHVVLGEPMAVADLQNHDGPAVLEGTAYRVDGTVTAPFSGTECLVYDYTVKEHHRREIPVTAGLRNFTLAAGNDSVPFDLDDGTGTVRVEPEGADLRFESHVTRVAPDEDYPDRIEAFVRESESVQVDGTVDQITTEPDYQQFTEQRLDPGEKVYVYGEAVSERVGGWGSDSVNSVVRDGDSTPVFVVSDEPHRGTALRIARRGIVFVLLGLLPFAILGLGLVVSTL